MKKGGSIAAGIPYAAGAGQTDGKNGMMKKVVLFQNVLS